MTTVRSDQRLAGGARVSPAREAVRVAYVVTGAGGMLGTALQRVLGSRGSRFLALAERDLDITDPVMIGRRLAEFAESLSRGERGVLINAAAFTDVERAEDQPALAHLVNQHGPALLARATCKAGVTFVHVSTDFVFDGRKSCPYTEADEPNPLSVYGRTKLAGEIAVAAENPGALIVRTAWVFGQAGVNFPVKILEAARAHPAIKVVTDEVGSPTYTLDLAAGILALVAAQARGVYHLAGAGSCTRFELAQRVLASAGARTTVEPVTSDAFPARAERPKNSVLDCAKATALGVTMPAWQDSLARFMREPS